MKKFLLAVLLWAAMAGLSWAAVNDAPHNENSGVTCGRCHSYSVWWRYSPAAALGASTFGVIANTVCLQCHGDPAGQAPYKKAHSSASFETIQHGDWSTNCVDCHDPHLQAQLNWRDTDSQNLYLVTGTIGADTSFVAHPDGTTTFNYTMTAGGDSNWTDPSTWVDKNAAARSLIFVDDTQRADGTFVIVAADGETVTVKGVLPATAAGHTFGLIYGQMVKSTINTPNSGERPVKFFDPKRTFALGGFTDPSTPAQGVCQVCHTATTFWRNDGNGDPVTGELHNETIVCTVCHSAQSGFKPSGGPHTFLGETAYCVTCHQSGDILGVHHNDCQNCHTTPPTLADPASKPLVSQIVRGDCQACHGEMAHDSEIVHNHRQVVTACAVCHMLETAYDVDLVHNDDCSTCHGYNGTKLDAAVVANAISTGMGGTEVSCLTCHTAEHVAATDTDGIHRIAHDCNLCHTMHGGLRAHTSLQSVAPCSGCHSSDFYAIWASHDSNCLKCHLSSRPEVLAAIVESSRLGSGTPATCITCHGSTEHDSNAAHNHRVVTSSCAACHAAGTAAEIDTLHQVCATCHSSVKTEVVSAIAAGKGVNGTDVSCVTCHSGGSDGAFTHGTTNASVAEVHDMFAASPVCSSCHVIGTAEERLDVHPNCATCHSSTDPVVSGAIASGRDGITVSCETCHPSYFTAP